MIVQVNTDGKTDGTAGFTQHVQAIIDEKFAHFAERITRAEVHIGDENGVAKAGGKDKRCMIEVRLAGMHPISATDHAATAELALRGAADKMRNQLDTVLGKLGRS